MTESVVDLESGSSNHDDVNSPEYFPFGTSNISHLFEAAPELEQPYPLPRPLESLGFF